jgi:hypothetical protein
MTEATYTIAEFLDAIGWAEEQYSDQTRHNKVDLAYLAQVALREMSDPRCFSCGHDVFAMDEFNYMVHAKLWQRYGVEGHLCIGCFETRLGRQLRPTDFRKCDLTHEAGRPRSARLRDRIGPKVDAGSTSA